MVVLLFAIRSCFLVSLFLTVVDVGEAEKGVLEKKEKKKKERGGGRWMELGEGWHDQNTRTRGRECDAGDDGSLLAFCVFVHV